MPLAYRDRYELCEKIAGTIAHMKGCKLSSEEIREAALVAANGLKALTAYFERKVAVARGQFDHGAGI